MRTLQNMITSGTITRAQRITIYGPNGVGKSTLAKAFPSPIFIDTEDGSTHLDVSRIQASEPETFFDALRQLAYEPHTYQTLVIDSSDGAEKHVRMEALFAELYCLLSARLRFGKTPQVAKSPTAGRQDTGRQ